MDEQLRKYIIQILLEDLDPNLDLQTSKRKGKLNLPLVWLTRCLQKKCIINEENMALYRHRVIFPGIN